MLDAGNCLHLLRAFLQNRPEVCSRIGLCAAPRSNISHPEKEQVVAAPVLRLFSRAQVFPSDMNIICWHLAKLRARSGHVTVTVTSVASGGHCGQGNSKHAIL